ncbi:MAG: hypothetical protein M1820_006726 [Bogoriella megaspora]|nr:MAG: hypothetical protein M1820_006726 [Bogoriella megaspora]
MNHRTAVEGSRSPGPNQPRKIPRKPIGSKSENNDDDAVATDDEQDRRPYARSHKQRTESGSSIRSVASAITNGLKKVGRTLSNTILPQDGDPPSDYEMIQGFQSKRMTKEEKAAAKQKKKDERAARFAAMQAAEEKRIQEEKERKRRKEEEERQRQVDLHAFAKVRESEERHNERLARDGYFKGPSGELCPIFGDGDPILERKLREHRNQPPDWMTIDEQEDAKREADADARFEQRQATPHSFRERMEREREGERERAAAQAKLNGEASKPTALIQHQRQPSKGESRPRPKMTATERFGPPKKIRFAEPSGSVTPEPPVQHPHSSTTTRPFSPTAPPSDPWSGARLVAGATTHPSDRPISSAASIVDSDSADTRRETNFADLIAQAKGEPRGHNRSGSKLKLPKLDHLKETSSKWADKATDTLEKIARRQSDDTDISFVCAGVPPGTEAGEGFLCPSCAAENFSDVGQYGFCKSCRPTGSGMKPHPAVSPTAYTKLTPKNEFFLLRDGPQKNQRLIEVRQTTYEDPGNPFQAKMNKAPTSKVILEQKANEDSDTFMKRSTQWFLAQTDIQHWLQQYQSVPTDLKWETTQASALETDQPPVPAVPDEYVHPRTGWTKMTPKIGVKPLLPAASDTDSDTRMTIRDSTFYEAFHEIEKLYLDRSDQTTPAAQMLPATRWMKD